MLEICPLVALLIGKKAIDTAAKNSIISTSRTGLTNIVAIADHMTPRTIFAEVKMASLNLLLGLVATLAFAEAVMSRWRYPPHVRSNSDCPSIPAVVPLTARDLEKTLNELSNNITYYLKRYNAPGGVAVGLVYDQKLIWAKGFGKINDSGRLYSRWFFFSLSKSL